MKRIASSPLPWIFASLLAGGCSGAPAPTPTPNTKTVKIPPTDAKNATSTEPVDPESFSVAALAAPAKYVIDGDLSEWGSLLPKPPPPKPQDPNKPADPKAPPPPPLKLGPAASHVGVAIGKNEVLIAAELAEAAAEPGFYLGLRFEPIPVANIGEWARGGQVSEFDCEWQHNGWEAGDWVRGDPNPPEVKKACEDTKQRHEAFIAKNAQRFERLYKIDRDGIQYFSEGSLRPIEGAKVVKKPRLKGATIEISFPFKALPRVGYAPLENVEIAALPVTPDALGKITPDSFLPRAFPEPVFFDKYGPLRAAAFDSNSNILEPTVPPGLSYQPGDPEHVEALGHQMDPGSLTAIQLTLFEKIATLGDVEIGHVPAGGSSIAAFKDGKLSGFFPVENDYNFIRPVTNYGMIDRDGEKHFFIFLERHHSQWQGPMPPAWVVVAVAKDGTLRNAASDCDYGFVQFEEAWAYTNEDKSTLGLRGPIFAFGDDKYKNIKNPGLELSYRWDLASGSYKCEVKTVSNPKPPKKNAGGEARKSLEPEALDDLPGLSKRPAKWEGLREITVTGSSALTCVTQAQGPKNGAWFRAFCTGDKVLSVTPLKGHHKTQTSVEVTPKGIAEIFTPIAEGTEVSFKMNFEKAGGRTMTIRWKKGWAQPVGEMNK